MSTPTPADLRIGPSGTLELAAGTVLLRESPLFHLELDRRRFERLDDPVVDGLTVSGTVVGTHITATWSARAVAGLAVWELALELRNDGDDTVRVTRMDPLAAHLDGGRWTTLWFRSAWGDEYRPQRGTTDHHTRIDTRSGRSSHGASPWLGLEREGAGIVVSPAWSGNWHIDIDEGTRVSAGISTWLFETELAPGASVQAPSVVIAAGTSLDEAATALSTAVGRDWIPRSPASDRLDVEWNHWWPYEDAEVDERVIWRNAQIASRIGVGVVTVDAGWFGAADAGSYWPEQRGDWALVNTERFPSGLAALGDGIRERGARAGIWIEAEAVGASARVRREHPEIVALAVDGRRHDPSYGIGTVSLDPDDPTFLGYVCLGSEAGRAFVAGSLDRVVADTGAEWVKLDFNVDPDAGCSRTDHGHGAHDGLLRHYEGLYAVLDGFRERHPEVVLEACSSGGLRIDLGLARHVHTMFLSDPDYTEHALQVLWGASLMLPPVAILHWSWSQWRGDHPASQLDLTGLSDGAFATLLRAAMLHRFGFSLRLPELSPRQLEILAEHVALYRDTIRPFVRDGVLRRRSGQPERGGGGERMPVFELELGDRRIVAAYRLSGAHGGFTVDAPDGYRVVDLAGSAGSETSWLYLLEPEG